MLSVVSRTPLTRRCIATQHHTAAPSAKCKKSENISRHFSTEVLHSSNELTPSEVEAFEKHMCITPPPVLSGKKAEEFLSDLAQKQNVQNTLNSAQKIEKPMSILQQTGVNEKKAAVFSSDTLKNCLILEPSSEAVSAIDYFSEKFDQIKNRSGLYTNKSIFDNMTYMAKEMVRETEEGALTQRNFDKYSQQFAAFRDCMLAHLYLTMPSIAKQATYALKNGDYQKVRGFIKQLEEKGDASIKHLALAEQAFNAMGQHFGLPNITPQNTIYETSPHENNELLYAIVRYSNMVDIVWHENPALLFLIQKASSVERADMAKDVCTFFEALRPQIDPQKYNQMVVPYLQELKSNSFYREHTEDVMDEVKSSITDIDEAKSKLAMIRNFLKAQRDCFENTQCLIKKYSQSTAETVFYPGYSLEKQKISTVLSRGILDALTSSEPL